MTRILGLAVLGVLIAAPSWAQEKKDPLREYARTQVGRHAYGLYLKGKKVGWVTRDIKIVKRDGKDVLQMDEESRFELTYDGTAVKSIITATTVFGLEGEGDLLYQEEVTKENGKTTINKGERKGKVFLVTGSDGKKPREVAQPKATLMLDKKMEDWLRSNPKKDDTFKNWTITLDDAEIDTEELITYVSKKTLQIAGVATDVHTVKAKSKGAIEEREVRADGVVMKTSLNILEERLEPEATAKKPGGEVVDFLTLASIPVDKELGVARKISALTLAVDGLGDFVLPESHRQKVVKDKQGATVLEMRRDFKIDTAMPLAEADSKMYLAATPTVQSDDKEVLALAKKIVGDETDLHKKANRIRAWILENLEQTYDANANTTLEVLKNKAGDCTEHSLLFVSLARATGIPAREVGGVAYSSSGKHFAWHAWAEFHDGHQWVSADPTWNQERVDATHIKFSEGDDQAWQNVLGKVKFKVRKVERK